MSDRSHKINVAYPARQNMQVKMFRYARACGFADWDDLLAAHHDARQSVAALWETVTGGRADVD